MLFYACGGVDWAWQPDVHRALLPEKEKACARVCVCACVCETERERILERKISFGLLSIKFNFENLIHME